MDADFSPDLRKIINASVYDNAYKIAWEAPRFWERNFSIYGGISFLDQPVGLVWYPSSRLFSGKGVVIAGYGLESGTPLETMNLAEKLAASRESVEFLHPGHSKDLAKPVCVCWGRIPYSLGSWLSAEEFSVYPGYERVIQSDDPIFLAGDHVSHIISWQEGAALSAHRAVSMLTHSQSAQRFAHPS